MYVICFDLFLQAQSRTGPLCVLLSIVTARLMLHAAALHLCRILVMCAEMRFILPG